MNLTDDLTNGTIWKQLTALALPLIWGNILQQMYNTIDAFVVGHYIGVTAFAAAGVAGSIMNLSLFVISECCNGIAIIIAELYGQKNWDLLRKESFLSLAFGGGFTILLSLCGMLALQPLLISIRTPAEVTGFVQEYLKIIYLSSNSFIPLLKDICLHDTIKPKNINLWVVIIENNYIKVNATSNPNI